MTANDFGFDLQGVDRLSLLTEAAERLDLRKGHLGPGDTVTETSEGALVRALTEDLAEFAGFPVVYKITTKDFLSRDLPVPVRFTELTRAANFYWLYFPIGLFPRHHWAFNRLEVVVEFNAGEELAHARPKAYQILPQKQFQDIVNLGAGFNVRLNENFEFSADTGPLQVQVGPAGGKLRAGVDARAAGTTGMVAGPFTYRITKAKIDHTPTGMEKVLWRLDGAEFFQEDDPTLIVILQVPRETANVRIRAALQAYRYFSFATAGLQEGIKELPGRLREFFKAGLPLGNEATWDISPKLS